MPGNVKFFVTVSSVAALDRCHIIYFDKLRNDCIVILCFRGKAVSCFCTHSNPFNRTIHVSPFTDNEMEGGAYRANLRGLDHYRRVGYKGKNKSSVWRNSCICWPGCFMTLGGLSTALYSSSSLYIDIVLTSYIIQV